MEEMIQYKVKLISNTYKKDDMACSSYTRYTAGMKQEKESAVKTE